MYHKKWVLILCTLSLAGALSCVAVTSQPSSSTAPAPTSKPPYSVDDSIVQVWQPATGGQAADLLAFGVAVGDGSDVLTVLNYENYTPGPLEVVSPKYGSFNASVQAIDSRTSATLLKLESGSLPSAQIGDASSLPYNTPVIIQGWGGQENEFMHTPADAGRASSESQLFFNVSISGELLMAGKGWVSQEGGVVTDNGGNVLGLLNKLGDGLSILLGYPGMMPPVVSINSAMELLSPGAVQSPWMNGPVLAKLLNKNGWQEYFPEIHPCDDVAIISEMSAELSQLGGPLSVSDLPASMFELYNAPGFSDGSLLTMAFPKPVELRDSDGNLLARAKWVSIQWNRPDGQPDRLIYGTEAYIVDGVFSLNDNTAS